MKKIIIPTDFSEHAQKSYAIAAEFAKKNNSEIELYTVYKSHFLDYLGAAYNVYNVNQYLDNNQLKAEEATEHLLEHSKLPVFEGIKISCKVEKNKGGDLGETIYNHMNNGDYSYAVIGTEGVDKENETFAEIIARHVKIPIITVKASENSLSFKKILLCTDFNNINAGFLKRLNHLLHHFDHQITILYVNTPSGFKDNNDIEKAFNSLKRIYHLKNVLLESYNGYTVEDGVLKYMDQNEYDLVALTTNGRVGLSHFFNGSLTDSLINQSSIPVFSYNLHDYNENNSSYSGYGSSTTGGFVG